MFRITLTLLVALMTTAAVASAADSLADQPDPKDRQAILAMAGCYHIEFNFKETVALKENYELTDKYIEDATEWVQVVVDQPRRIVLQHLLIIPSNKGIVKHWRQEWVYQETDLLEFSDRNTWVRRTISDDQARGTWIQKVYSTDDSPRYQGYGKWTHTANLSAWESEPTRRPLPRREYSKRDDYQALRAVNRHIITPHGWVHEQDNTKLVINEAGQPVEAIARETGLNRYLRVEDAKGEPARKWWNERGKTWTHAAQVWDKIYAEHPVLKIQPEIDDKHLSRKLAKQVYKLSQKDLTPAEVRARIRKLIEPHLIEG